MKKSSRKTRRRVSERDMLIEQCMMDAYCERMGITPDQLDEGWWDSMKAGAAGAWAGAKQGIKRGVERVANAGRVAGNAVGNMGRMAGNAGKFAGETGRRFGKAVMGNDPDSAAKGNYTKMNKLNQGTTDMSTMMPAGFAKNFAKAQSFSKSASETLGQWVKAMQTAFGENFPGSEAITAIQQSMDQVVKNNAESAWKTFGGGKAQGGQPAAPARDHEGGNDPGDAHDAYMSDTENEESLQDSYDPTRNSRAQRLMLESIR